jgi:uncharacterized Zn finger protein
MDLTASCKNESCVAFGREKPVTLEQMLGCNVASDRVRCHACGTVMTTNQPAKTPGKSRVDMMRSKMASVRRFKQTSR